MTTKFQTEFITDALKDVAGMAITKLETQKSNVPFLRESQDLERTGKCRWPVLNQLRIWLTEAGETP